MISEAIVFSYCNQFYAIELQHFVTILNSQDISLNQKNNEIIFCINGEKKKGSLININKYLGIENRCTDENSSIILGKLNNTFFGFGITKVEEMLNIDDKYVEVINEEDNEFIKGIFSFDGNYYSVLNIGKIVEENINRISY